MLLLKSLTIADLVDMRAGLEKSGSKFGVTAVSLTDIY